MERILPTYTIFHKVLRRGLEPGQLDPEASAPTRGHASPQPRSQGLFRKGPGNEVVFSILKIVHSLNRTDSSPISNSVQRQRTRCLVTFIRHNVAYIWGSAFLFRQSA